MTPGESIPIILSLAGKEGREHFPNPARLRRDFGYGPGNYREGLDAAIRQMSGWWQENRATFELRAHAERQ